ncbi:hypothetical protein LS70_004320 [Helicobacter sp. MIT 11-5569]|uniref:hypothetical protein n=1 Tax=Helicobacter sp. MIT 11-5569 TaxID=1548151 RepID=UPI00068E5604|nr:hypothetical protein [Helicobacter sp. MIT 11-5569]TLD84037.1 hypothetical protein LS70_004320 [Helicobacter sp. MIT 11-5569]
MQDLNALKELTKKLDTIKESWQIYAIFEDARKNFNEEFSALKKDKEALIESFNTTSAKNALLLAENKELEAKNKALLESNKTLESSQNHTMQDFTLEKDSTHLYAQCENLQDTLKGIQTLLSKIPNATPKPLQKLEVSYQKHQRLLANPAKGYVSLESATALFNILINVESKIKTLDSELAKLQIEMRDFFQSAQNPTEENLEISEDSTESNTTQPTDNDTP